MGALLSIQPTQHYKNTSSSRRATRLDIVNMTTLNDGYLGSRNDEERSEMRYVMRIAEFSESSNL